MKFRIYIDEVGNSDLNCSGNPNHQFLSLTGVILELDYCAKIVQPEMETLKRRFFAYHPDEPVIFHRKEMMNCQDAFKVLKNRETAELFDNDLLHHLSAWDYSEITVCIDKKKHKDAYVVWRYDPYHYCLTILLERYVFFLNQNNAKGDVMAESRGGKEDMRLKASFEKLWGSGTEYVAPELFQNVLTSRQLKVKSKANNIAGLQIADLVAHPSRNEILTDSGYSFKPAAFAQKVIKILQEKYYRKNDAIFGKKLI
jgi:hypothetical protein